MTLGLNQRLNRCEMSEALNGASERIVEFYKICSCSVISNSINQSMQAWVPIN